jgi:AraC-like DNA-binding protein
MCEFEGNGVIMSFQKKGKASCVADLEKGSMYEKQNNIFFHSGLVRCRLTEADCFRIVLSKSYVNALWKLYPEAMSPLVDASRQCRNCVFDHSHLHTTLEMEQIINDIENLYLLQEDGKEMVIEAKIRELLYIQIMQHLKMLDKKDLKIEKYRKQMQMVCNYIENNIQDLPSLHNIAMVAGVCDTILKIAFKYFYGKTVFEYFNEYRLNKACNFLANPSYNISDVAYLTGYKHSSYFSTAFKQKYGLTPIEYRTKNMEIFSTTKAV